MVSAGCLVPRSQSIGLIPVACIFFGIIKPTIAPDPEPLSQNIPLAQIEVHVSDYRDWVTTNTPLFNSIYDELRNFLEARRETCTIIPPPQYTASTANPRPALADYMHAIDHLTDKLILAIKLAKEDPSPQAGESALVTLIRNQNDGTWKKSKEIQDVLETIAFEIMDDIPNLQDIDSRVSQAVKIPWEPSNVPGYNKLDIVARFIANPEWKRGYPPGLFVLVKPDQKYRWISAFEGIAEEIDFMSRLTYSFSNLASDYGLGDAVYTKVLDTPKHNPSYGVEGARPYTAIDLFRDVRGWYECWAAPVREVARLSEMVTPLPGSVEEEVLETVNVMGAKKWTGAEAA
ncbi:hypothetical protein TWF730_010018 [Orbilia blumenaviensis]|uniref:Uncharacterized protein n=1 Tax=Orbilia blumenaviensis TaxID=1796055 RepID=A0AAV9UU78_9PEZI